MSMFRGTLTPMTDEIETISEDDYNQHAVAEQQHDLSRLRNIAPDSDVQRMADELRAAKMPCVGEGGEQQYDADGYPIS
jgi:hypothetical protein